MGNNRSSLDANIDAEFDLEEEEKKTDEIKKKKQERRRMTMKMQNRCASQWTSQTKKKRKNIAVGLFYDIGPLITLSGPWTRFGVSSDVDNG
jgi:hypothetical protein